MMGEEIANELKNLLSNYRKLKYLLKKEKERRGVNKSKLVFVGTANIAGYWWCAEKAFLKSLEMELDFFRRYLHDRILYSIELEYFNGDKLPKRSKDLLAIGNEITFEDVMKLLKRRGNRELDKSEERKRALDALHALRELKDIGFVDDREYWQKSGILSQIAFGECYPTIRWNFEWEDFVIVGVPDGITNDFVYEFKTTRSEYLLNYILPIARAQADIYGYFFKKPFKKIQIYIFEINEVKTFMEKVNVQNALDTLRKFRDIVDGKKT